MAKHLWWVGCGLAFLAVAMGAFGSHALEERLTSDRMDIYQTAVQYHMFHAFGVILAALALHRDSTQSWFRRGGWLLAGGVAVFSGSLYLLSLSGVEWLGAITPIGGVAFLAGWVMLAAGGYQSLQG